MAQLTSLKCKGLFTHPNELGTVPEGALLQAKNCVIDKEDILENRRGSIKYGIALANVPSSLFTYRDHLIAHHGTKLSYDSDGLGTWADYTGTFSAPTSRKIRSFESNQNFYFTTSEGMKKIDSLTSTPISSGAPKALDGTATLNAAVGGFLADGNCVAYRVVWGIKDLNENLILGAPSQRFWVSNASGNLKNIDLEFTIPDGITVNHIYQVYRSQASGGAAIEANDELQLAYEGNPTAGQLAAKLISLTDITVDGLLGATLYTSPSQEGIAQANDEPPFAKDVTVYRDHAIYGNTEQRQNLYVTLIGTGSPSLAVYTPTANTTLGDPNLTTVSSLTGLAVGQIVSGTGIATGSKILTITAPSTVTLDKNCTANGAGITATCRDVITIDGTDYSAAAAESIANKQFCVYSGGTPADDIEDTASSLVRVINRQTTGVNVYAYYMSGYNDLPGKIWVRDRVAGGGTWAVTSSKGTAFSPTLPTTGSTVSSSNEAKKNRIYISKPGQPEAVPYAQFFDAGSADKEIFRVIALRDSVFILKQDGVYRLTGTSVDDFQVTQFDNTAVLVGIETAVPLNNQVFAYTTQGVVAISDTGVQVVSRPIEIDLTTLSSDLYPNFESITFAVSYETERKYILFTPTETTDVVCNQAWVFNSFTNAWTTWELTRSCAIVNPYDDRLYMGNALLKYIHKSRKDFVITDFADDEYSLTITAYSSTTVEVNSTADAVEGQTLYQNEDVQAVVSEVVDGTTLTVDREADWALGAAKLYDPVPVSIQWAPVHGGLPGTLKQFSEAVFFFKEAVFALINVIFGTNFAKTGKDTYIAPKYGNTFGEGGFGDGDFGGDIPDVQPIRTYVPLEQQRGHWLNVSIEHAEACTQFALAGIGLVMEAMDTKFK